MLYIDNCSATKNALLTTPKNPKNNLADIKLSNRPAAKYSSPYSKFTISSPRKKIGIAKNKNATIIKRYNRDSLLTYKSIETAFELIIEGNNELTSIIGTKLNTSTIRRAEL